MGQAFWGKHLVLAGKAKDLHSVSRGKEGVINKASHGPNQPCSMSEVSCVTPYKTCTL